jgi:hypothetical protein
MDVTELSPNASPALRVYDPWECRALLTTDGTTPGAPMDYDRCRDCDGTGKYEYPAQRDVCPTCGGHGSLRALALHVLHLEEGSRDGRPVDVARCEDCAHPMSDGTWEGVWSAPNDPTRCTAVAARQLRAGKEPRVESSLHTPDAIPWIHYSDCDGLCRHRGPGRYERTEGGRWETIEDVTLIDGSQALLKLGLQASWRLVDVRFMGWPHDLRPERLALLCLRCYVQHLEGRGGRHIVHPQAQTTRGTP